MNRHAAPPRRPRAPENGVALVLTLAIIALLCLMVLGLTSTMKIERDIAVSYGEDIQARRVGEAALARALFCLTSNTPPTAPYVAAPGQIWQLTPTGLLSNGLGLFNQDNRTNERPLLRNALEENNLNWAGLICGDNARYLAPSFLQDTNWFTQTASPPWTADPSFTAISFITPGWVCLGTNHQQAGNFGTWTNPIIARFSFWIDAETCKVNVNTAGRRDYTNSFFPPQIRAADVDLRALRGAFAGNDTLVTTFTNARYNYATSRQFPTHEAMRGAAPEFHSLASFQTNKFATTIHGTTPDLDVFGAPRTDLNLATVAWTNLAAFTDSRYATEVYPDKNWDSARNSFQKKYGSFGIAQILANIQGYRGAPINDALVAAGDDNAGIPAKFSSLRAGPLISQFIVHVATNYPSTTNVQVDVHCRFKVVNGYETNLTGTYSGEVVSASIILTYTDGVIQTNPTASVTNALTTGVAANSFADWVLPPLTNSYTPASGTPVLQTAQVSFRRARLLNDAGQPLDWIARQDFTNTLGSAGLSFTNFGSAGSTIAGGALAQSIGKHDPRVRTFPGWEGTASFASNQTTLTANWTRYTGAQISTNTDDSCSTNFSSALAPTRFGLLANPRADNGAATPSHRYLDNRVRGAAFTSVGELGYIHTGYPWRTIRLGPVHPVLTNTVTAIPAGVTGWATNVQFTGPELADFTSNGTGPGDPNTANPAIEINAIPDWVLLDMFTAGTPIPSGRININNRMSGPAGTLPSRTDPIGALIWNAQSNLNATAGTSIGCRVGAASSTENLYNLVCRSIAEGASSPNSPYAAPAAAGGHQIPAYRTPGEICESLGINYVPTTTQPSQADRTRLLTRIAPLITASSDTFTIWAIAEHVEDTDRDGVFDWMYQAQYRYTDRHPSFSDSAYTNYILNATNYVTALVDGDGNGTADNRQDRICGRFRIQAIVQRYFDPSDTARARPKYRTLFVRYIPN